MKIDLEKEEIASFSRPDYFEVEHELESLRKDYHKPAFSYKQRKLIKDQIKILDIYLKNTPRPRNIDGGY